MNRYPATLLKPDAAARRACLDAVTDPALRVVVAQLLMVDADAIRWLWDDVAIPEPEGDALVALAARLLAPMELARATLGRQEGHHRCAIAQLETVLALNPECAEAPLCREAINVLRGWEAKRPAGVLAPAEVRHG